MTFHSHLRRDGSIIGGIDWNYDVVTRVTAQPINPEPLVLRGGNFTNIANRMHQEVGSSYWGRNIRSLYHPPHHARARGPQRHRPGTPDHRGLDPVRKPPDLFPLGLRIDMGREVLIRNSRWIPRSNNPVMFRMDNDGTHDFG